jgi:hypothetical protein
VVYLLFTCYFRWPQRIFECNEIFQSVNFYDTVKKYLIRFYTFAGRMMNKKHYRKIPLILASILLSACNSTPDTNASKMGMNIPQWVSSPSLEKGLAASSCVLASSSFSMDKSQAAGQARVELASNVRTRVAKLQEEYSEKVTSMGTAYDKSTVKQTTLEFVEQEIQGSRIEKVDYAQMGANRNLCVMVTLSEKNTQKLFAKLLKQAPIKLTPENETLLYLNFLQTGNNSEQ